MMSPLGSSRAACWAAKPFSGSLTKLKVLPRPPRVQSTAPVEESIFTTSLMLRRLSR
jgi:hypothetical protein